MFRFPLLHVSYVISSRSHSLYQYPCLPAFARCSLAPYKVVVSAPRFTGPRRFILKLLISFSSVIILFFLFCSTSTSPSTSINPHPSQTQTKPGGGGGGAKRSSGGITGLGGVGGVVGGSGGVGGVGVSGPGGDSPDATTTEPTLDPITGILSTPGQLKPPLQQQPQAPVSQRFMHVHACALFYLSLSTLTRKWPSYSILPLK